MRQGFVYHGGVFALAFCLALGLVVLAGEASAQVATGSLTPFEFVTENPAALQWGAPSRIGVAYLTQQQVTNPASVTDNFTGLGGGGSYVGKYFSLAAESTNLTSNNRPYSVDENANNTAVAVAGALFEILTVGYSQQSFTSQFADPTSSQASKATIDSSQLGVTVKLGDWFYVGGSTGQDTGKFTDASGTVYINGSRDVNKFGLGVRTETPAVPTAPGTPAIAAGDLLTHFEYYVIDRSKFSGATAGTTSTENQQTGVAEVIYSSILVGYRSTHIDRSSGFATTDSQAITLGYAPTAGWTFAFIDTETKDKLASGSTYTAVTNTQYAFALTYLFEATK